MTDTVKQAFLFPGTLYLKRDLATMIFSISFVPSSNDIVLAEFIDLPITVA